MNDDDDSDFCVLGKMAPRLGMRVKLDDGRTGRILAFSPSRTRVLLTSGTVCSPSDIVEAKWI